LSDKPYRFRLQFLLCGKIAFDKDLEGIANRFGVLSAKIANALL
jgi:hypothetical protein